MGKNISREELNRLLQEVHLVRLSFVGRAGSMLMQSLLDSHPQIASFPISYGRAFNAAFGNRDLSSFLDRYSWMFEKSEMSYLNNTKLTVPALLGENRDQYLVVDKEGLVSSYRMFLDILGRGVLSVREYCLLLNLAHYHSRGFDISKVKYVLYHLHTLQEDVSAELMEEFPEAKTIIMTRDPREGWVGWRKTVSYRNYGNVFLDDMEHFLSGVKKDLDQLIAFKKRHGSPIHIIDLAELHSNGREIMQGVCDFLHVDFDESLLESTFMGLKWWGNASDRKPVSGLDKNRGVKQFPTAMSPLEIAVFDDVFSQYKADFKYAPWELQMDQGEITGYLRREFRNQFFKIRFYLPNYRHILRLQSYFEEGYYRRLGHVAYLPDNRLVHSAVIWIYVCYRYICSAKVRLSHVIKVLRGNVNRSHSPRYQGSQKL